MQELDLQSHSICLLSMQTYFFLVTLASIVVAQDGQLPERSQRWAPFGEPYQQRLVSLIPSNPPLQTTWPPIPPYPSPWSVESSPSWPDPVLPPWSPYSWQQPAAPSVIYPPQAPVTLLAGPQEQSSRDLDVGVYTGIDTPFTQIPPFSRTVYPGYSGSPQPAIFPSEWKPRDLDVYSAANEMTRTRPQLLPWTPYPWLRQQGGFNLKPSDNDVKLTMHVPKDGLPGGVLVMEMKASVYRPVY